MKPCEKVAPELADQWIHGDGDGKCAITVTELIGKLTLSNKQIPFVLFGKKLKMVIAFFFFM